MREPHIYGELSLDKIQHYTQNILKQRNIDSDWFQSNLEGEIINQIQACYKSDYTSLVINPGGYSHTSVAILDALKLIKIPVIEVHLSNVYAREDFRKQLLTAQAATMIMSGLGKNTYLMAVISQEINNIIK